MSCAKSSPRNELLKDIPDLGSSTGQPTLRFGRPLKSSNDISNLVNEITHFEQTTL